MKTISCLVILGLLASTATASCSPRPSFVKNTRNNNAAKRAISMAVVDAIPRGGAGPLDVDMTAKVLTAACGATGVFACTAPKAHAQVYGLVHPTPTAQLLTRIMGVSLMKSFVTLGLPLFGDGSRDRIQILGYTSLVGAIGFLQNALATQNKDTSGILVAMVHHCVHVAVAFANPSWASTYFKVSCIGMVLMFTFGLSAPKELTDWWNLGVDSNNGEEMHMARCGIHFGILDYLSEYLLLQGNLSLHQVLGVAWLVAWKFFAEMLFVLKTVDSLHLDKTRHLVWFLVQTVAVVTFLF